MAASVRIVLALTCVMIASACAKDPTVAEMQGKAFLARNAHAPGVHVTASGLQYKVLASGAASGRAPREEDQVQVNYEGRLLDGTIFDSSYQRGAPAVIQMNSLIPGWVEALQLMRPGDVWEVYVPADLAYGDQGTTANPGAGAPADPANSDTGLLDFAFGDLVGGGVPPGSTLKFKIELMAINPAVGASGG
jgi:FKBP-type peptidyl-prolyl cis-trans isomerase